MGQSCVQSRALNNSKLERAHIIASSIGGPDTASNYLLLCKPCHLDAPMTNDRDLMITWAKTRASYEETRCAAILDSLNRLGADQQEINLALEDGLLNTKSLLDAFKTLQADSHTLKPNNPATAACVILRALQSRPSEELKAA